MLKFFVKKNCTCKINHSATYFAVMRKNILPDANPSCRLNALQIAVPGPAFPEIHIPAIHGTFADPDTDSRLYFFQL
jgi:hypothetical protein